MRLQDAGAGSFCGACMLRRRFTEGRIFPDLEYSDGLALLKVAAKSMASKGLWNGALMLFGGGGPMRLCKLAGPQLSSIAVDGVEWQRSAMWQLRVEVRCLQPNGSWSIQNPRMRKLDLCRELWLPGTLGTAPSDPSIGVEPMGLSPLGPCFQQRPF